MSPLAYTPPGVNVAELYSPSVSPLLSASANVCLVGLARGYEVGIATATFSTTGTPVVLNAPLGAVFQRVDTNNMFESVTNLLNPSEGSGGGKYLQGTDFQVTLPSDAKTVTITPIDADSGTTGMQPAIKGQVRLVYRFVRENYYTPTRLASQSQVEAYYGAAFDTNGIVTPLAAAAALAFENGAASVIVAPLVTNGRQPTAVEAATSNVWEETLLGLRDIEDVNVIVPIVGQSDPNVDDTGVHSIHIEVQDHAKYLLTQGQYVVALFGEDSSGAVADATLDTIRTHADDLGSRYAGELAEQTVLVSPSRFERTLPSNNNKSILVGGQYVAAAIAGMLAARPVSSPLTRKQVSGFTSVAYPLYDKSAKDTDAAHGCLVVEQKGLVVQVRHGLTLNTTDTAKRELSVVRAKHRMMASIKSTIDTQVIGTVPADGNAPLLVQTTVIGVLERLRANRDLVSYNSVVARTLTNDPTTVEVRFSYRPAFPLNYVNVVFSLDLTVGDITTTSIVSTV